METVVSQIIEISIETSHQKLELSDEAKKTLMKSLQKSVRKLINALRLIKILSKFLSQPIQIGWEYDTIQMITEPRNSYGSKKDKSSNVVQSLSISVKKTFAKSTVFKYGLIATA